MGRALAPRGRLALFVSGMLLSLSSLVHAAPEGWNREDGTALVYVELPQPCKSHTTGFAKPFRIEIINIHTGQRLWFGERINFNDKFSCHFMWVAGKTNPIPDAVFDMDVDDLGLRVIANNGYAVDMPIYTMFGGGAGTPGPQGPMGPQGPIGPMGEQGPAGPQGEKGSMGPQGEKGPVGPQGERGPTGLPGPAGEKGDKGAEGPRGLPGVAGAKGDKGDKGDVGPQGPKGEKGDVGPQGPMGPKGDTGLAGPVGPKGDKGDVGPAGVKGDKGDVGAQGPMGPKGEMGSVGPAGPKGEKGDKGDTGLAGAAGPAGPAGAKGEKGDAGPAGPMGPAGPKGDKGDKGDAGLAGPVGPMGPKGEMGSVGPMGPKGEQGPAGPMGPAGSSDIHIGGDDDILVFETPDITGEAYTVKAMNMRLSGKADKRHTHEVADLTGAIPSCQDVPAAPICREGRVLRVGGVRYAPASEDQQAPLLTDARAGLKLGAAAGRWNDIALFESRGKRVVSLTGSVQNVEGVHVPVNLGSAFKVRILGDRIQEFHDSPTDAGRDLFVEIRYVAEGTQIARKH